ncbi:hypothetical protein CC78DRAFT_576853 [Lojkania enalia]|uniref:Uncharacterized protein n=1 Tax=Lojkania enalia TaxID=147567 RepID=A0A9P4N807_9PLEO|nr:hypothetical protein CC78DRAFT_576853 [Didymosphaeria enalia]
MFETQEARMENMSIEIGLKPERSFQSLRIKPSGRSQGTLFGVIWQLGLVPERYLSIGDNFRCSESHTLCDVNAGFTVIYSNLALTLPDCVTFNTMELTCTKLSQPPLLANPFFSSTSIFYHQHVDLDTILWIWNVKLAYAMYKDTDFAHSGVSWPDFRVNQALYLIVQPGFYSLVTWANKFSRASGTALTRDDGMNTHSMHPGRALNKIDSWACCRTFTGPGSAAYVTMDILVPFSADSFHIGFWGCNMAAGSSE